MKRTLLCLCLLAFTFFQTQAQSLKSPDEFLGYKLGTRFTPNYKVVDYYEYVTNQLSNAKIHQYGQTNELRPLISAIVSSQENIDNWETIRIDNLKRAKLMEGEPSGRKIGIVWLSYNVHGNEANSTETAMKTLYEIARPDNSTSREWLKNTVVIFDPSINPDGRDRYSNWINQVAGTTANPNPDAAEHNEPWPGGRANHYLFDLNRDWAWQTQVESQQRMKFYNTVMPHIHVDFHEQGSNSPYYFAPAAEPVHEQVTQWQRDFQDIIGKNHAKYFDENGWLFFTKESFDMLYPSYGDSYPMFNGAIGMTYEQGSSDLAILTDEGDTLKLEDAIAHHHTTGMSTVETASKYSEKMVDEFANFFNKSVNNPKAKYKTYVVRGTNHPDKLKKLTDFLDSQQIVYGIGSSSKAVSSFNYLTGKNENAGVQSGDIIISAFQPKAVLVQAFFEPNTFASTSDTYDITAWAVPYMMGLDAYATETKMDVKVGKYTKPQGQVNVGSKPAAYLLKWETLEDAKFLGHLLKSDIKLRFAEQSFSVAGNSYAPGTLIITRKGNMHMGSKFDDIVKNAAKTYDRSLTSTPTTFVETGKDFGSNGVKFLDAPKILVLRGDGVSSLGFGEFWYFMEQELNYPITMVDVSDFGRIDLDKYNTLVLPSGSYGSALGGNRMDDVKSWVRGGGKIIAIERSINTFAGKDGFSLKTYATDSDEKDANKKTDEEKEKEALTPYADRSDLFASSRLPGAIFKLKVDNTNPLAFGYPDYYFTLKNNSSRYAYLAGGGNVGIIEGVDAYVSGVAGDKAKERLAKSVVFGVESYGRGSIVYMADNPLFRAFWQNGKLFVANSIFFVGQ
ncbi:M14 family zinc carboxypeptidase [Roseivirga echinicomitans]|uniref:Zinc carboxypeptidase n=1 Tax=Roseivirga echinicomitans TaxID=296218 RepID=A0A150XV22_9BACT|nr:M14 family metallopeptidase [Roseivirga echinicomitans]KYG82546.1 zinc carboxypeptidase [Roseivirga echinicomitans]